MAADRYEPLPSDEHEPARAPLLPARQKPASRIRSRCTLEVSPDGTYHYSYGPSGLAGLFHSRYALLCASVASIGGLSFGYDQGVIANILVMRDFVDRFPVTPLQQGILTAVLELGALVGALAAGALADRFSRRQSIFAACLVFLAGSLVQCLARALFDLVVGRAVGGVAVGALSMLSPLYISEVSPPELRGSLMALEQFSIVLGCVLGFWTGFATRNMPGSRAWRLPLAAQLLPGALLAAGCMLLPPSPRLLVLRGAHGRAWASLCRLRGVVGEAVGAGEAVGVGAGEAVGPGAGEAERAGAGEAERADGSSRDTANLRGAEIAPTDALAEARTSPGALISPDTLVEVRTSPDALVEVHTSPGALVEIEFMEMRVEAALLQRTADEAAAPKGSGHILSGCGGLFSGCGCGGLFDGYGALFGEKYRERTMVGIMAMFFQQWVGINALLYYGPTLVASIGLGGGDMTLIVSGGIGIAQFVAVLPAIAYIDRWGRRPLLRGGAVVMGCAHLLIALLVKEFSADWDAHRGAAWLAVGAVYVFTIAYGVSIGPIGWVLPSEVFPLSVRSKGVALSTASVWVNNFLIGLITPALMDLSPAAAFALFASASFAAYVWATYRVPETAGVALEDVGAVFGDAGAVFGDGDAGAVFGDGDGGAVFGDGHGDAVFGRGEGRALDRGEGRALEREEAALRRRIEAELGLPDVVRRAAAGVVGEGREA